MQALDAFNCRLTALDLGLFFGISGQSDAGDRRAWLAVQRSIRRAGYVYLETGSYLGGSIQQHLLDPLCTRIISIDSRRSLALDDRGETIQYPENSTENMLANLRRIDATSLGKLVTFDVDASEIDPLDIPAAPHFCFIDGEHTRAAVLSDFEFCLRVCDPDAAICFHDARIVDSALREILSILNHRKIPVSALRLGGDTFGIFLRNCPVVDDHFIRENSSDGMRFLRRMHLRKIVKAAFPRWMHRGFRAAFPAP